MEKEKAIEVLSKIPAINFGGCLLAAFVFYQNEKTARRSNKLKLVSLCTNVEYGHKTNKAYTEGKIAVADSACHFGWTYDNGKTIYDTKGIVSLARYKHRVIIPKKITSQFSVSSLNNGVWNPHFDRKKHLPKIARVFNQDLSMVNPEANSI
jgi:hypothetical protein